MQSLQTTETLALQTLSSLSNRLSRIEHALVGTPLLNPQNISTPLSLHAAKINHRDHSIRARLSALEAALTRLANHSKPVHDLLSLHASYPEIFIDILPSTQSPPSGGLTIEEKASIVLSAAPQVQGVTSQLVSLRDIAVPDVDVSIKLIELQPRVDKLAVMQEVQGREMAELRRRSLKVLERWYEVGVEGVNECFAEWDERVGKCDRVVRRRAVELEINGAGTGTESESESESGSGSGSGSGSRSGSGTGSRNGSGSGEEDEEEEEG
ncbi:hypothetical protein AOL_s00078g386 [Orbilia oligospora ATCC 24927]|uniref:Nuclear distribution protein RO10 n=1 Tax=Arthrobotrys oligospora (strain ATCC 24927 / CBS 115.81 / DSM 1491) TaxID=756982 RepID=G1XBT9_ARTOA|nr:hypothetical protein AOL_s00078g386 [Orbilia oligospora ATCC 24927]EGX49353.1 hypothetical protein AOL_s00078g386 [Orbilia oligospora ATCC 24927]